jgi:hypothetical protein
VVVTVCHSLATNIYDHPSNQAQGSSRQKCMHAKRRNMMAFMAQLYGKEWENMGKSHIYRFDDDDDGDGDDDDDDDDDDDEDEDDDEDDDDGDDDDDDDDDGMKL